MVQSTLEKNIKAAILEDKPKKNANADCYLCGREYLPVWQGSAFCSERCATAYDEGHPPHHEVRQSPEYHMFDKATKPKGWHIVAGPPVIKLGSMELKVGDMYYDEKGIPVQLKQHTDEKNKKHEAGMMVYLLELVEVLGISKSRIHADKQHGHVIHGRNGDIWVDSVYWYLYGVGKSRRQFSTGIKAKLKFMKLVSDNDSEGEFRLDRMPSSEEAEIIRKVLGLKKSPKEEGTPLCETPQLSVMDRAQAI